MFKTLAIFTPKQTDDGAVPTLPAERLEELANCPPYTPPPPSSVQVKHAGLVRPLRRVERMPGFFAGSLVSHEKKIPASAVNRAVDESEREIKEREGVESLDKDRHQAIRDAIMADLIARTPASTSATRFILDSNTCTLYVMAAGARAEDVISHLRGALGTMPVTPILTGTGVDGEGRLTRYLDEGLDLQATGFTFADYVKMAGDKGAAMTCTGSAATLAARNAMAGGMLCRGLCFYTRDGWRLRINHLGVVSGLSQPDEYGQDVYDRMESFDLETSLAARLFIETRAAQKVHSIVHTLLIGDDGQGVPTGE